MKFITSWHVPTMMMDATMPVEIVRQFFPQMEEPVIATAAMPHTRVRQIADRPMTASMLIPSELANEKTNNCSFQATFLLWCGRRIGARDQNEL